MSCMGELHDDVEVYTGLLLISMNMVGLRTSDGVPDTAEQLAHMLATPQDAGRHLTCAAKMVLEIARVERLDGQAGIAEEKVAGHVVNDAANAREGVNLLLAAMRTDNQVMIRGVLAYLREDWGSTRQQLAPTALSMMLMVVGQHLTSARAEAVDKSRAPVTGDLSAP